MMTSSSCGVMPGLAEASVARYWMNCEFIVIGPPDDIGTKLLQVASGSAVLPPRSATATLVPAGVVAFHWMLFQSTGVSASKMREKKVPVDAYGDIRIQ